MSRGSSPSLSIRKKAPWCAETSGAFFLMDNEGDEPRLTLTSSYAYRERKNVANSFRLGEGIVGQCAQERKTILLTNVPPDYIQISSGLGEAAPLNLIVKSLQPELDQDAFTLDTYEFLDMDAY